MALARVPAQAISEMRMAPGAADRTRAGAVGVGLAVGEGVSDGVSRRVGRRVACVGVRDANGVGTRESVGVGDEVAEGVSLGVGDDGHSVPVGEAGGAGEGVPEGDASSVGGLSVAVGDAGHSVSVVEARGAGEGVAEGASSSDGGLSVVAVESKVVGGAVDGGDVAPLGVSTDVGWFSEVVLERAKGVSGASGIRVAECASSSAGGLSVMAVAAKGVGGAVAGGYGAPLGVSSSVGGPSVEAAAKGVGGLGGAVSAGFVSPPVAGNGSDMSSGVEKSAPAPEESEETMKGLCRGSGPGRRGGAVAGAPGSSSWGPEGRRVEPRAIHGGGGGEGRGEAGGEVCARAGRAATERDRHKIKRPPAAIHERTGQGARTGWVMAVPL